MRGDRAPRVPASAVRILRAVRNEILAAGAKLVWLELWLLDATEQGCYLGTDALAMRTGFSRRAVQDHLQLLEGLGLVERIRVHNDTREYRVPVLPPEIAAVTKWIPDDQLPSWRDRLERELEVRRATS